MTDSPAEPQGIVFVVSDNRNLTEPAKRALATLGFSVHVASSGRKCVDRSPKFPPDAVLLDVSLPDMDASEVCRELRGLPATRRTPILLLAGVKDLRLIERAYEAGATDFVMKPPHWLILAHRVRYLVRAESDTAALVRSEAQLSNAHRLAQMGWWEWEIKTDRLLCSEELHWLLAVQSPEQLPARFVEFLRFVHPQDRGRIATLVQASASSDGRSRIEYRVTRGDDEERIVSQQAQITRDDAGRPVSVLATVQDITEQKLDAEKIRFLAEVDPVTGLPNRHRLIDRVRSALSLAEQHDRTVALMFLDLDGFKRINDGFGHTDGDRVLREAGERLTRLIRKSDLAARDVSPYSERLVARFGGDEFVILLSEVRNAEDPARVAQRAIEELSHPYRFDSQELIVTVSIGIAVYPTDGVEPDTLLKHADTAMYEVKEAGGNGFKMFTDAMNVKAVERLTLESGLRGALEREEFVLHYQPKMSVKTGSITGVEALVRWKRGTEILAPDRFIAVCEASRLIVPLGSWILERACRQLREWHAKGLSGFRMAVNVSARQFNEPGFAENVLRIISAVGLDPSYLELELTESTVMANPEESGESLRQLKGMGLRLAIDDFGTGYSSLGLLRRFPLDALKIDRSFVQGIPNDLDRVALTSAILTLAQTLGLEVVAEGVEDEEQRRFLETLGCDEIQGYLISRPVPPGEIPGLAARPAAVPWNGHAVSDVRGKDSCDAGPDDTKFAHALQAAGAVSDGPVSGRNR